MQEREREKEIVELLQASPFVTVDFLAQKLHISASSIRRDLSRLESRGLIRRRYGGAELVTSASRVIPFSLRSHENSAEKKRIARKAASLLKSGDTLYLDGSTSAFYMIDCFSGVKNLTVITNSVDALCQLTQYNIRAFCTGGQVSSENRAVLVGGFSEHLIENLRADYVFFSAQAVWEDGTIYDCYESEVPIRRKMMASAARKVFLCDSSKFGKSSVFRVSDLNAVDCVITDKLPKPAFLQRFPGTSFLQA